MGENLADIHFFLPSPVTLGYNSNWSLILISCEPCKVTPMTITDTDRPPSASLLKSTILLFTVLITACAQFGEGVDTERFERRTDGTVLDTETALMWAGSASSESMTWEEAGKFCSSYRAGGHQDWRLPTRSELTSLLDAGIDKKSGPIEVVGDRVWASETDDNRGAYCNFFRAKCGWLEKVVSISLHGLPVRTVKAEAPAVTPHELPQAPPPRGPQTIEQRLQVLEQLYRQGLLTEEEYTSKRAAILNDL